MVLNKSLKQDQEEGGSISKSQEFVTHNKNNRKNFPSTLVETTILTKKMGRGKQGWFSNATCSTVLKTNFLDSLCS